MTRKHFVRFKEKENMINETILCPHCGAEMSPGQTTCTACGKPSGLPGESMNSKVGIGAVLGGVFAVLPQFLLILMFCPGVCDSPGVVSIFGPLVGVNFILGAVVGYVVVRVGHSTPGSIVGAILVCFLVGVLSTFAAFILAP